MRTCSTLLLIALTACSSTEDTDTGTDTASTDTADTADTADTEDSEVPEVSPFANCTEEGVDAGYGSWTSTYDGAGNMVVYAYSFGANYGTFTYVWDDRGNWLEAANDIYDDGTIDQRNQQAFDERGNRVLYASYTGDTLQFGETRTYVYNDDGTQTMYLYWDDTWTVLAGRYDTTFDTYGNRVTVELDREDDGTIDTRMTYTYVYDGAGNPLSISYDADGNGEVDSVSVYTYDTSNRALTHEQTTPTNPDRFLREAWEYDADGNILLYVYEASGVAEQHQASRFDEDGREVERTYDVAPLGSADRTLTWTYTCP